MDSPSEIVRVLQVVLGIGLVIFVHELGHYLAARLCKVRVETFSLGFGPRLFGWRVGPTYYQVALVPLGGFCRMAGEERRFEGLPPEPDELPAKGVGQRFFIYSGGVLMNLLFGLVVFPILFQVGVPFTKPVIGDTVPGGPAWQARVPPGSEVLQVNENPVFEFAHLYTEVALGDPRHSRLLVRDPATGAEHTYDLVPERDESEGIAMIGVRPGFERDAQGNVVLDVQPDSPAARAGLVSGDRLVEVVNGVPGLWLLEQLNLLASGHEPWELVIEGAAGRRTVRVAPELTATLDERPRVGIAAVVDRVKAVRASPLVEALDLCVGDRILAVNERPLRRLGDFTRALLADGPLVLRVLRGEETRTASAPALSRAEALALASDVVLEASEDRTEIYVQPGEAGERAGLRSGDVVLQIDGTDVHAWQDIIDLVGRSAKEERVAEFRIARTGEADHLSIAVRPEARPLALYGLAPRQAEYVYRAESWGAAIAFGGRCSWRFLEDSWLTLKRMLTRDVSPKNLGGIITIGAVSYSLTEAGWVKLFFFLCLVSINLAFLNILPIPVLDGGHLFFLIIEKLKGSPVSNRVLSASQAVGVVLLLSLMVYVTYNDLVRFVFPAE